MKIAFLDLNHITCGIHTNTVPLGSGLISIYLKKNTDHKLDIKIFKEADKAIDCFSSWVPDVIGLAQYVWNSELNLFVTRLVKKTNPNCLVVAGGPNQEQTESLKIEYLKTNCEIDICISYDGEVPFKNIINRLLTGETIREIKEKPVNGTYSLAPQCDELIESSGAPPRLSSLNEFGAIYSEGYFDELLDDGYHPFHQTHRGCPFSCIFCNAASDYSSRIIFLSEELFKKDMDYLGQRYEGQKNIVLYLANTNMSLYNEDFKIAQIIKETQEKYNWPAVIKVNSGKDPKKLIDMLSIVNFRPGIALQTLTPSVLNKIKRKNIPFNDFVSFQNELIRKTGQLSATELILCLPGETMKTFLGSLKKVINSGVQDIVIFTLMNLKGSPLNTTHVAKQNGFIIKHRVVPRQFSEINGSKVFDTEEVIVGTNDISYEEYLKLREISFTVATFLSSSELIPLKKLLVEYNCDIAEWVFSIHERLQNYPDLFSIYKSFCGETQKELFPTREALLSFFEKSDNFKSLTSGRRGDNLLRKYKCIILFENYESFLKLAITEAKNICSKHISYEQANSMIDNISTYLATRNMKYAYSEEKTINRECELDYDIPRWLTEANTEYRLEDFHGLCNYTVKFLDDTLHYLKDITLINKELKLSLQILYRDGNIKDFWPVWIKKKAPDYDSSENTRGSKK